MREALRLLVAEGLPNTWRRHASTGRQLRDGLTVLGLQPTGMAPYSILRIPNESEVKRRLRDDFGVEVTRLDDGSWRVGLLGADARPEVANRVLAAFEKVLRV